jgi:hypothetical protein
MCAVAQGFVGTVFAAAEIHGLAFISVKFHWRELRPFVRAVAKRLGFALPAGTPVIAFACLDIHFARGFLKDMGFHRQLLCE